MSRAESVMTEVIDVASAPNSVLNAAVMYACVNRNHKLPCLDIVVIGMSKMFIKGYPQMLLVLKKSLGSVYVVVCVCQNPCGRVQLSELEGSVIEQQ